jgi:hypothetical protein
VLIPRREISGVNSTRDVTMVIKVKILIEGIGGNQKFDRFRLRR